MDSVRHDLRLAIRQFRKTPGFALAAILTLGFAIGAATSMFSVVDSVLLRPLPFTDPDRLFYIAYDTPHDTHPVSYPNYFDFRARTRTVSDLASYRHTGEVLSGFGPARMLDAQVVSGNLFRTLGVAPIDGSDFTFADEQKGTRVAMLSWQLWQSTFGGKASVVGAIIHLGNEAYTVAGIMPRDFTFPIDAPPDLWITLASDDVEGGLVNQRGAGFIAMAGRLQPGVTRAQADAEFGVIARNLAAEYPDTNADLTRVAVKPEADDAVGDARPALRVLFAAVGFVLLIGCVNVAGLMLARVSRRRSEIALLAAVGARRGQILRMILLESLLLSSAGGLLGILLAAWGTDGLLRLLPTTLPRLDHVSINAPVLLFAIAISMLTGILAGVLPAWKMSGVEPLTALRGASRGITAGRAQNLLQNSLVVAETALGLTLLIGAGLLIRSFLRLEAVKPGFDPHNVLAASLAVPDNHDRRLRFYNDLGPQLAAIPGVESVSSGWPLPLSGNQIDISFEVEGRPNPPGHEPSEFLGIVNPGFFHTMRIPVVAGREFTAADTTQSKLVMLVNEAFARKYFPGENVIGKHLRPGLSDGTVKSDMREVVGVVGNVKRAGFREDFVPQYYLAWAQTEITWPTLVIRTSVDPAGIESAVRAKVAALDPSVPVYRVRTLEQLVDRAALAEPRFQTLLLAMFAFMALALAAIGLYALLSYTVAQRAGEIGVRMALGARREDVLALILGRGAALALPGIAIGAGAAALLSRHLSSLLYRVEPLDPWTFASVSALLLLVSLAASAAPAARAARLDPARILRSE